MVPVAVDEGQFQMRYPQEQNPSTLVNRLDPHSSHEEGADEEERIEAGRRMGDEGISIKPLVDVCVNELGEGRGLRLSLGLDPRAGWPRLPSVHHVAAVVGAVLFLVVLALPSPIFGSLHREEVPDVDVTAAASSLGSWEETLFGQNLGGGSLFVVDKLHRVVALQVLGDLDKGRVLHVVRPRLVDAVHLLDPLVFAVLHGVGVERSEVVLGGVLSVLGADADGVDAVLS